MSLVHKVINEEPDALDEDCDDDVGTLVNQLLVKDPSLRPTADQALGTPCLRVSANLLRIYRKGFDSKYERRLLEDARAEDMAAGRIPPAEETEVLLAIEGCGGTNLVSQLQAIAEPHAVGDDTEEEGNEEDNDADEDETDSNAEDSSSSTSEEEDGDGAEENTSCAVLDTCDVGTGDVHNDMFNDVRGVVAVDAVGQRTEETDERARSGCTRRTLSPRRTLGPPLNADQDMQTMTLTAPLEVTVAPTTIDEATLTAPLETTIAVPGTKVPASRVPRLPPRIPERAPVAIAAADAETLLPDSLPAWGFQPPRPELEVEATLLQPSMSEQASVPNAAALAGIAEEGNDEATVLSAGGSTLRYSLTSGMSMLGGTALEGRRGSMSDADGTLSMNLTTSNVAEERRPFGITPKTSSTFSMQLTTKNGAEDKSASGGSTCGTGSTFSMKLTMANTNDVDPLGNDFVVDFRGSNCNGSASSGRGAAIAAYNDGQTGSERCATLSPAAACGALCGAGYSSSSRSCPERVRRGDSVAIPTASSAVLASATAVAASGPSTNDTLLDPIVATVVAATHCAVGSENTVIEVQDTLLNPAIAAAIVADRGVDMHAPHGTPAEVEQTLLDPAGAVIIVARNGASQPARAASIGIGVAPPLPLRNAGDHCIGVGDNGGTNTDDCLPEDSSANALLDCLEGAYAISAEDGTDGGAGGNDSADGRGDVEVTAIRAPGVDVMGIPCCSFRPGSRSSQAPSVSEDPAEDSWEGGIVLATPVDTPCTAKSRSHAFDEVFGGRSATEGAVPTEEAAHEDPDSSDDEDSDEIDEESNSQSGSEEDEDPGSAAVDDETDDDDEDEDGAGEEDKNISLATSPSAASQSVARTEAAIPAAVAAVATEAAATALLDGAAHVPLEVDWAQAAEQCCTRYAQLAAELESPPMTASRFLRTGNDRCASGGPAHHDPSATGKSTLGATAYGVPVYGTSTYGAIAYSVTAYGVGAYADAYGGMKQANIRTSRPLSQPPRTFDPRLRSSAGLPCGGGAIVAAVGNDATGIPVGVVGSAAATVGGTGRWPGGGHDGSTLFSASVRASSAGHSTRWSGALRNAGKTQLGSPKRVGSHDTGITRFKSVNVPPKRVGVPPRADYSGTSQGSGYGGTLGRGTQGVGGSLRSETPPPRPPMPSGRTATMFRRNSSGGVLATLAAASTGGAV